MEVDRHLAGDVMEPDGDSGAAAIHGRGSEKETWIDLNFCFFFVYVFLREVMNFIMFLRVLVVWFKRNERGLRKEFVSFLGELKLWEKKRENGLYSMGGEMSKIPLTLLFLGFFRETWIGAKIGHGTDTNSNMTKFLTRSRENGLNRINDAKDMNFWMARNFWASEAEINNRLNFLCTFQRMHRNSIIWLSFELGVQIELIDDTICEILAQEPSRSDKKRRRYEFLSSQNGCQNLRISNKFGCSSKFWYWMVYN